MKSDYHIVNLSSLFVFILQGGKGKKLKTDRKKGVPFRMMFRHHKDPSYYDPKANDKIFVPDI
jgi:hypothetical protein